MLKKKKVATEQRWGLCFHPGLCTLVHIFVYRFRWVQLHQPGGGAAGLCLHTGCQEWDYIYTLHIYLFCIYTVQYMVYMTRLLNYSIYRTGAEQKFKSLFYYIWLKPEVLKKSFCDHFAYLFIKSTVDSGSELITRFRIQPLVGSEICHQKVK